ncbi:Periplasmic substrate-binding protein [Pseudomonas viridiflava]|uniref:Periplasmic substrate-binding protein n=1 Tax=Pseudomonas viridiflava TaxID=33069 RepID=A0A3M5PI99_PSEVI|nr:Periplasmic substrate-binding protein [Pseudomonas viridiflava]
MRQAPPDPVVHICQQAEQANGAVDAALSIARGETLASPVIWVPFKLITPENRQQFE